MQFILTRNSLFALAAAVMLSCNNAMHREAQEMAAVQDNGHVQDTADRVMYGTWVAHFEHVHESLAGSFRLVLLGSVEIERVKAKVTLMKEPKQQYSPSELVLTLTKRPLKRMDDPVVVNYAEQVPEKYSKVRIMYRKDTVAILNNIAYLDDK